MGELKRIVFQKKFLLSILALLAANLFLFQYFQMDTLELIKDETLKSTIENSWQEEQSAAKEEFTDKIQKMEEQSKSLSEISIFSNEDTFSNKNIWRTLEDFEKIKNVRVDTLYSDKAVSAFLEYDEIFYFLLLFVVIMVLHFFDERKSGLWQITYNCKNGRTKLAFNRLGILFLLTVVFSGLMFFETLIIAFVDYGGKDILFSSVQSVVVLQDFTLPISVLEFLFYYWGICAGTLAVSGLFVWGILSLVHNRNLGIVLLVIVYGIEMVLYYVFPEQHPLCVLRYFNLWFFVNPKEIFIDYINFPIGTFLLNLREFVQWVLIGLLVILAVAVCYINKITRPFYVAGIVERLMQRLSEWCKKGLCHCSGICFELYKLLFQGKGIFVIVIFSYLIISGISKDELLVSPAREQLNDFYAVNTQEVTKESMVSYEKIETELNEVYDTFINAPDESKKEAEDIYQSYEATRVMFRHLQERLEYAKSLEKKGLTGWWLNETGYRQLLGEDNITDRMVHGALAILVMIFMLSGSLAMERQSGVCYILRSTKKGRKNFFFRKEFCAMVVAVFVWVMTTGAELYEVGRLYPFRGLSAPVQNISFLEAVPFSLTIGQFLCIWILMRMLIYIMIANMCLMISSLTERVEKAQMLSLVLLVFTLISGVSEYMIIGTERLKKTVAIVILVLICLCISIVTAYRRWRSVND